MIIFNLAAIPSIIINVLLFYVIDTYFPALSGKYGIIWLIILTIINIPIDIFLGSRLFFMPISLIVFLTIFYKVYTDFGIFALLGSIILPILALVYFLKDKKEKENIQEKESEEITT